MLNQPTVVLLPSLSLLGLVNAQGTNFPDSGPPKIIKIVVPIVFAVFVLIGIVSCYIRYRIARAIVQRFEDSSEAPSVAAAFFGRRRAANPLGLGGINQGEGFRAHDKGLGGGGMMSGSASATHAGDNGGIGGHGGPGHLN
ncbi:hypothetical protein BKA70DRAFT_1227622 [Coprinopsis sp. MPI-PUGE-AT-0042]|nr:hypothetical protein BKA70DRAFT_1227622 [Coprinopsis sp. MPI-PUGE-AT-0042]